MSPTASASAPVLEYSPAETSPLLDAMLPGFARLCRQLPPGMVRIVAENSGFSSNVLETRRETDCLLVEAGFELVVPHRIVVMGEIGEALKMQAGPLDRIREASSPQPYRRSMPRRC
jgi:hypothetical protein